MASSKAPEPELYEVLTRRPDGHETVHRVVASSQAAAERKVRDAVDGDRRRGFEVAETARFATGGLTHDA